MKMLREGMQDYEYLNLLTTLGDSAFAQTELAKVVTNAGSFASDPTVLEQAKLDMATEIEKVLAEMDAGGVVTSTCDGGPVMGGDGGHSSDAGPLGDGGTTPSSGGCSCDVAPASTSVPVGLAVLVFAVRSRRKRATV